MKRKALKPGDIIKYFDTEAIVVQDDGTDEIIVDCDGFLELWEWKFENFECEVVKRI